MFQPPPAEPGMSMDDIDTLALVIDLDAFHANLDLMANFALRTGVKVRPHAKTHKSPVIAKLQIARRRWPMRASGGSRTSRLGRRL